MHPNMTGGSGDKCPKCGMGLELEKADSPTIQNEQYSLAPLFIILGLILLISFIASVNNFIHYFNLHNFMNNFMAAYFITFAGFKLLDIKGFAQGYSMYDLLAKRFKGYGYVYPFIELILGIGYMINFQPVLLNLVTVIVMGFSGIGVAIKILKKERFQCACLGTFLKVPLTKITLIEDFGMGALALWMLLFYYLLT